MGQQDILDYLKENADKWFFAREISTDSETTLTSTSRCLRRLRQAKLVNFRIVGRRRTFQYKYSE